MHAEAAGQEIGAKFISVSDQRLHIAIRPGNKARTPLLMMNGVGANLEMLQPFVDALDPDIEVIRFDVPGTGRSPTPRLPYRFSTLCVLLSRMLDHLGYPQVDVLGVSWGGALAQQFAMQYARICRRLVLVSTATGSIMVPGRLSTLRHMMTPRRYSDPAYMAEIAGHIYGGSMRTKSEHAKSFAQSVRSGDNRGYLYQMMAAAGWTSLPWISLIRQPTLIMSGDDDPIIPLANARLMYRLIPNSKLHVFNDGHLGLATQAKELAPVVEDFLSPSSALPPISLRGYRRATHSQ